MAKPATSLRDILGQRVDSDRILQDFVTRFFDRWDQLETDASGAIAEILTEVRRRCIQIGQKTTVREGFGTVTGLCTGIADDGSLILETRDGIRHVR